MKPLTPNTPRAIIMVGIPGSGKSTFAEHFANTFQAPIINERAIALATDLSVDAASKVAALMLGELLKTRRTIIYEGLTSTKVARTNLIKQTTAAGYVPLIVWVQTESLEAKRRATRKQKDAIALTEEEFDAAIRRFTPPSVQEKAIVISGKHTYASQLKIVLKRLAGEQRPELPPEPRIRSSRTIILR
ncbi:MAG: AAA family ATPase [Candidatus Saccharimonadales bacterium]